MERPFGVALWFGGVLIVCRPHIELEICIKSISVEHNLIKGLKMV